MTKFEGHTSFLFPYSLFSKPSALAASRTQIHGLASITSNTFIAMMCVSESAVLSIWSFIYLMHRLEELVVHFCRSIPTADNIAFAHAVIQQPSSTSGNLAWRPSTYSDSRSIATVFVCSDSYYSRWVLIVTDHWF